MVFIYMFILNVGLFFLSIVVNFRLYFLYRLALP